MLVSCAHCGATIARAAPACPQCGGPQWQPPPKKKTSVVTWLVLIFFAAPCLGGVVISAIQSSRQAPSEAPASAKHQRWLALQNEPASLAADRRALIAKLQESGVIHRIERRSGGNTIHVGPLFYEMTFEQKQNVINAIVTDAWKQSERADQARLVDYRTNKKIGTFFYEGGLDLD